MHKSSKFFEIEEYASYLKASSTVVFEQ